MSFNSHSATQFKVTHDWNDIELSVSIDFNIISVAQLKEYAQNHFDCPKNLSPTDDAIIDVFLKILARTCFRVSLFNDLTVEGLRDYFNNAVEWGAELFPPMDGSKGILIESFTFDSLDDSLFEISRWATHVR